MAPKKKARQGKAVVTDPDRDKRIQEAKEWLDDKTDGCLESIASIEDKLDDMWRENPIWDIYSDPVQLALAGFKDFNAFLTSPYFNEKQDQYVREGKIKKSEYGYCTGIWVPARVLAELVSVAVPLDPS